MRRFLGANLNINGPSSADLLVSNSALKSPVTPPADGVGHGSGSTSAPTSATNRALQTFGQMAYSKSLNGGRKPSPPLEAMPIVLQHEQQQHDNSNIANITNEASERSRAGHPTPEPDFNPPVPPSKSPYMQSAAIRSPEDGGEGGEEEEEEGDSWDAIKLPFSASQGSSTSSNGVKGEQQTQISTKVPHFQFQNGLEQSDRYRYNASSLVDLKDDMMMELLSSDALLHVGQFEILGLDEIEELRKVWHDIL